MRQIQQQREELALRKQEADLRGKLIDVEMQKLQRGLKSGDLMQQLLGQTETVPRADTPLDLQANPEAAGTLPVTRPRTPSLREMATAIAGSDPEKAANLLWQQQMLEQGQQNFSGLVGKILGGGGGSTPAPAAAPEAAEPVATNAPGPGGGAMTTTGPGPVGGGGLKWTMNFDKLGNGTFSLSNNPDAFSAAHQVLNTPDGRGQIWEIVTNTRTGQTTRYPIGQPLPPDVLQRAAAVAEGLGAPRGSALHAIATPQVAAALALSGDEQSAALEKVGAGIKAALGGKSGLTGGAGQPVQFAPLDLGAIGTRAREIEREKAVARTVPTPAETQQSADAQTWIVQARKAAQLLEDYTKDMSVRQRLSFAGRVRAQGQPLIGAIPMTSEKEREITSAIGNLQIAWERASGGMRMAASPLMQERIRQIFGDPTNAATPTHLRTIANMMEQEIRQRATVERQAGRPALAAPSGELTVPSPRTAAPPGFRREVR